VIPIDPKYKTSNVIFYAFNIWEITAPVLYRIQLSSVDGSAVSQSAAVINDLWNIGDRIESETELESVVDSGTGLLYISLRSLNTTIACTLMQVGAITGTAMEPAVRIPCATNTTRIRSMMSHRGILFVAHAGGIHEVSGGRIVRGFGATQHGGRIPSMAGADIKLISSEARSAFVWAVPELRPSTVSRQYIDLIILLGSFL
jgi:hypothetical protein